MTQMANNNVSGAQQILDAIQRDELENVGESINAADSYLLRSGDKPSFYDDFIERTISDLKTTINGCVKSRNNDKKKDDLKKYKEGYINEIVQNANDVVWKSGKENPTITLTVSKEDKKNTEDKEDKKYTVECTYPDAGFTLQNIYGFCTRGNSDKKSENGQEGMYGIGIKSLLCFVDELHISSNIQIDIISSEKMLDTASIEKNKEFNNTTSLRFSFSKMEENRKHAGFNTQKLVGFIDKFYEIDNIGLEKLNPYLINGKDEQMIFDVRSLFFTELRGNDRTCSNSIKSVVFKKVDSSDEIRITSKEAIIDTNDNTIIKIVEIDNCYKYLLFHFKEEQISLAYKYDAESLENDRLYSTYFIGTYNNTTPILDYNISALINTTAINSSRSGLERENEKPPEILKKIRECGQKSIQILCQLINNNNVYVDILCQLLYANKSNYINKDDTLIPQGIFESNIQCVEESISSWLLNGKKYILKEEDGVESEKVTINRPPNSDENNITSLYNTYKKYMFKEEDVILYKLDGYKELSNEYKELSSGIKNLSSSFFDETTWISALCLPFFNSVKDLIVKRIGGTDFTTIHTFLNSAENDDRTLLKQLIARYRINECFDFMGNYSDKNIGNWIFNKDDINDNEFKEKSNEYEQTYGNLKKLVQSHINESPYYWSNNWNASHNWWYDSYENKGFSGETIYEKEIILLLDMLCKKYLYIGYNSNNEISFVTNQLNHREENICLHNRVRSTSIWDGKFKYFSLDILNRVMCTFDGFEKARAYIDKYNNSYSSESHFRINYLKECNIKKLSYQELDGIFKWLAVYDSVNKAIRLVIRNIEEIPPYNNSDLINFTRKFIGDVNIQINKINPITNGRKFIGFITNRSGKNEINIKWSASDEFKNISFDVNQEENTKEKHLFIYTNYDSEQDTMAKVLEHLNYGEELCNYIKNYIQTGNITELTSREFNKFIKQKRLTFDYPFTYEECQSQEIDKNISMENIYTILSGEMSYDDHCPICNTIPTLNIMETDMNNLKKRNCLVAMLLAKYKEKSIYVKIICCKSCFDRYKKTLTSAEIKDVEETDIKILILKEKISSSIRSRNITNEILLSPDNWKLIRNFNGID